MGITLYNRGQRTFDTAEGKLSPGKSMTVSEEEAKLLEGYPDLIEFSKLHPAANELAALKTENHQLRARVKDLEMELKRVQPVKDVEPEPEKASEPEAKQGREPKKKGKK